MTESNKPTIVIKITKDGQCQAHEEYCHVKKNSRVQWYGEGTVGCVIFEKEEDWPFQESYQEKIEVPEDGSSNVYKAKTEDRDYEYKLRCIPCKFADPAAPGGGHIIIDP